MAEKTENIDISDEENLDFNVTYLTPEDSDEKIDKKIEEKKDEKVELKDNSDEDNKKDESTKDSESVDEKTKSKHHEDTKPKKDLDDDNKEKKEEKSEKKNAEHEVKKEPKEDESEKTEKNIPKPVPHKRSNKKRRRKNNTNTLISVISISVIVVLLVLIFYSGRLFGNSGSGSVDIDIDDVDGDVAAFVNGEAISFEEINSQYERLPPEYKAVITRQAILDQLVVERLMLQEAVKNDIEVTDYEVEEMLNDFIEQSPLSRDEFEIRLAEQNISFDEVEGYYRNQLIITKLVNETVFSSVSVTESDISEFYEANSASFNVQEGQVRARHILVNSSEVAEDLIEELEDGADFAELAMEHSTGPSSVSGGDLGVFGRGQMVPEFEEVAFALEEGETSGVVQTDFGYHIIKREPGKVELEDVRDVIEQQVLSEKQRIAFDEFQAGLRAEAEIEIFLEEESGPDDIMGNAVIDLPIDEVETPVDEEQGDEETPADEEKGEYEDCIEPFGISKDTLVFYYAEDSICPACGLMKDIVDDLDTSIHYADVSEKQGLDVVNACFKDVIQRRAPSFVCAGTGELKLGKMSESSLKDFAESCN